MTTKLRSRTIIMVTFILTFIAAIVSIGLGSVQISITEILKVIFGAATASTNDTIILDIRMPRVLLAMVVGANIAISGALLQGVMGNPLADPGLTGVTSGASVCVLLIMLVIPEYANLIPLAAFVGGVIATVIVYTLAWRKGGIAPLTIILSGIAVNALAGGVIGYLSIMHSDKLPTAVQWMNGSLASKGQSSLYMILPYSIIGWIVSLFAIRKANIIRMGDQVAANLGVNVNSLRIVLSLLAVFLAAMSVAAVGMIGFIGLIVPHMARLMVGSDYKYLLPMSMILGAFVLLLADTMGRTLFTPLDIPAGILMAVIGAPYFLYLMRRNNF